MNKNRFARENRAAEERILGRLFFEELLLLDLSEQERILATRGIGRSSLEGQTLGVGVIFGSLMPATSMAVLWLPRADSQTVVTFLCRQRMLYEQLRTEDGIYLRFAPLVSSGFEGWLGFFLGAVSLGMQGRVYFCFLKEK